eukprot:GFUD01015465.1.p1 GENE.GFUD01015465.1~~GFUD01015465.1.p1  ORF type:complete len:342 (+),score=79.92 GFUD01015465.1:129-1154(+)
MLGLKTSFLFLSLTLASGQVLTQESDLEQLLLVLGGAGEPSVALFNQECDKKCSVEIPDVPQPYGAPGRTGSYAASLGDTALVCGGLDADGPPISSFKDCQVLDLATLTWSVLGMANYSAHGVSAQLSPDQFTIFGGENTRYNGPGPTEWVDHNQIQHLDVSAADAKWTILEELTRNDDPFLGSCAAVHNGKVLMTGTYDGSSLFSFDLAQQKWEVVLADTGFFAERHGCAIVELNGANQMVFIGGDYNLAVAVNLENGDKTELPRTSFERSHRPVLTVVGSHLVVHGGNYNNKGFATEEALSLDDLEGGWQVRTVEDVSRVDSPAVVIDTKFFQDCTCGQ